MLTRDILEDARSIVEAIGAAAERRELLLRKLATRSRPVTSGELIDMSLDAAEERMQTQTIRDALEDVMEALLVLEPRAVPRITPRRQGSLLLLFFRRRRAAA